MIQCRVVAVEMCTKRVRMAKEGTDWNAVKKMPREKVRQL